MRTHNVSDICENEGNVTDQILNARIPSRWEIYVGVLQGIFRIIPDAPLGSLWISTLAVYGMIHYAALTW